MLPFPSISLAFLAFLLLPFVVTITVTLPWVVGGIALARLLLMCFQACSITLKKA